VKFSGGTILLILLVLALLCAMVITLWTGGSRSRHGYGYLLQPAPFTVQMMTSADIDVSRLPIKPVQAPIRV
jgi:hypothetical protein